MKTILSQNIFYSCVILFLIVSLTCQSQIYFTENLDGVLQLRVKHIEDFINRFNYTQNPKGDLLQYNDSLKNQRAGIIFSLFSKPLIGHYFERDTMSNWIADPMEDNTMKKFLQEVSLDSIPQFLLLDSKKWLAESKCIVKYKGENDTVTLFMSFMFDNNLQLSKWVIDSCTAHFFDITANNQISLSPVSHNMNFMQIGKAYDHSPEDFSSLAYPEFKSDNMSILFFAIKNKMITIDYVAETIFHFWQIPGYYFTVENIEDNSPHSGWLVTHIDIYSGKIK